MLNSFQKAEILNAVTANQDAVVTAINRAVRRAVSGGTGPGKAQILTALIGGLGLHFCEDDTDAVRADDDGTGLEIIRVANWVGFDSSTGDRHYELIASGKFASECVRWTFDRAMRVRPDLQPERVYERFLSRIRASMTTRASWTATESWRSKASASRLLELVACFPEGSPMREGGVEEQNESLVTLRESLECALDGAAD